MNTAVHMSLLCKLQQGREHRPCTSRECDCQECAPLEWGRPCECACHALQGPRQIPA